MREGDGESALFPDPFLIPERRDRCLREMEICCDRAEKSCLGGASGILEVLASYNPFKRLRFRNNREIA